MGTCEQSRTAQNQHKSNQNQVTDVVNNLTDGIYTLICVTVCIMVFNYGALFNLIEGNLDKHAKITILFGVVCVSSAKHKLFPYDLLFRRG